MPSSSSSMSSERFRSDAADASGTDSPSGVTRAAPPLGFAAPPDSDDGISDTDGGRRREGSRSNKRLGGPIGYNEGISHPARACSGQRNVPFAKLCANFRGGRHEVVRAGAIGLGAEAQVCHANGLEECGPQAAPHLNAARARLHLRAPSSPSESASSEAWGGGTASSRLGAQSKSCQCKTRANHSARSAIEVVDLGDPMPTPCSATALSSGCLGLGES